MTNRNHTKRCYEAFKSIYGPQHSTPSPLFGADNSKLISEKEGIMDRWTEHFNKVLNCSFKVNERALARIFQTDQNAELDAPLGVEEVTKTINQISSGKALGSDSIPVEVYKRVDLCWPADSQLCSKPFGRTIWFPKNWKTHYLFQSTDARVVDNLVITSEVSLYYQLQEKSLLVRGSLVFSDILRTMQLSQRVNVAFTLVVAL